MALVIGFATVDSDGALPPGSGVLASALSAHQAVTMKATTTNANAIITTR
jgi:hypothetical protein